MYVEDLLYGMEYFVNFLVWIFTLMGITIIVTQSSIFNAIRQKIAKLNSYLGMLVSCPLCFSFWAGLFLSHFYTSLTGNMFFDALLASGVSWYMTYESPQMHHH